jgi:hypothetical protein
MIEKQVIITSKYQLFAAKQLKLIIFKRKNGMFGLNT